MDWGLIGVILAGVSIAAAVVIPLVIARRQTPKRSLEYFVEATRLVDAKVPLEISFDGVRLADPHLVQIGVESVSRADIATNDFDAGRAVPFALTPPMIATIDPLTKGIEVDFTLDGFAVVPQLLKPGAKFTCSFLIDGPLRNLRVENSLVNVEVKPFRRASESEKFVRLRNPFFLVWIFGLIWISIAIVAAVISLGDFLNP